MGSSLSDLVFDSLILGSDVSSAGAFAAVFVKLRSSQSAAGLSLQSLVAVLSVRFLHLCSHLMKLHYTPKVLPKILYPWLDAGVVASGFACIVLLLTRYFSTYEVEKDNFGIQLFDKLQLMPQNGPRWLRPAAASSFLYFAIILVAFLWSLVRQSLPNFKITCYCCLYEAGSAVALLPQLWMFHKDKRVPSLLATFVVLVAAGRLCTFLFWWIYPWVYRWNIPTNRGIQMFLEGGNLLILSDFLFYWARAKLRGEQEVVLSLDPDV